MEQNKLKDLMENLMEQPSKDCWSNIESKLNVMIPESVHSSIQNGATTTTTKSGSILSKIALSPFKAAAITGSIAVLSVVSIIAIQSYNKIHKDNLLHSTPQPTALNAINTDTIKAKNDTIIISISENRDITTVKEEKILIQNSSTTSIQNIPVNQTQVTSSITTPVVTPILISNLHPDNQIPTSKPITTIVPTNQDPVVQDQDIPVSIPVKITIPNVFTPNGDGYNDLFIIEGIENCVNPTLIIKNSSGKKIFQSNDYQNDWNGENCPDGVYIYYFVYKVNNIEEKMVGRVIIKR